MIRLFLAALCVVLYSTTAEARQRQRTIVVHPDCNIVFPCIGVMPSPRGEKFARAIGFGTPQNVYSPKPVRSAPRPSIISGRGQVVSHPTGCPSRAFCGCGAAVRVFGAPIRSLWLAANWLRFPRTAPAPGMVAARRGHVFVLERHISGNTWLAYDANSGRRLTRIHPRSIAGFAIVNPRG